MRVLIAEDEPRLAAFLEEALLEAGWVTELCATGAAALAAAADGGHDVLVLDWMLPGLTGPEVVAALRSQGRDVPVLLLTARGDIGDRVAGLDAGADDYLAKPFDLQELLARIRALHRRGSGAAVVHHAGDLTVDAAARSVTRAGSKVGLTAREFDILLLLIQRAGRVVTRYTILDQVWDGDTDLRSNVIDVHIASLRAKVDRPFARQTIVTLRGAGYRLDPDGR